MFNPVEIIIKKRSGQTLSSEEMEFFIKGYIAKQIPDYQMSSLLMAIFFQGMSIDEVQTLTKIYIESGKQINFPDTMLTVDKHSTGGVGDKISLMLAPIVVACGLTIPMISGRGLGHTGGTLDKLEAIPGFRTDFNDVEFKKIIEKVGFSIISQSKELVPADKVIYALRDVSGTVESLNLITASIMSKKIAEGAKHLVIDLKVGSGAFMKTVEQAEKLAELLEKTGEKFGQKVAVVFTNMNSPLGNYVGNGLEVVETIEYLKGDRIPDIHEITKTLAVEMLITTGLFKDRKTAGENVEEVIDNGQALKCFRDFVEAQGGNPAICENTDLLPQAKFRIPVLALQDGWIKEINSQKIGYALIELDAGRKTLESQLNYGTGAYLPVKVGHRVDKGMELGLVFADSEEAGKKVALEIGESFQISESEWPSEQIILSVWNKWI